MCVCVCACVVCGVCVYVCVCALGRSVSQCAELFFKENLSG